MLCGTVDHITYWFCRIKPCTFSRISTKVVWGFGEFLPFIQSPPIFSNTLPEMRYQMESFNLGKNKEICENISGLSIQTRLGKETV
jgi:hypothetical protein